MSTLTIETSDAEPLPEHAGDAVLETLAEQPVEPPEFSIGPGNFPGFRRPFRSLLWLIQVLLGIGFLLPLLAGMAAVPGLSLLSLGLMLDAESQVGRSGRLRDGFPLLPISTRIGTIGLMIFLFLIPIMMVSALAADQAVLNQLSPVQKNGASVLKTILQAVIFCHLLLAIFNGGSFTSFIRPFRNIRQLRRRWKSGEFQESVNEWTEKLSALLKPWYHFRIAIKGAIGALCWLIIPTLLLGSASTTPHQEPAGPALLSLLGGILMIPVAAWLPLLQCHQAATDRFRAIFEVRTVRNIICRVPLRWALATILMYGLAIPLYFSKIVLPPADAFWLFTPLFIIVIYPTRLLMGWVYGQGMQKEVSAPRLVRWPTKLFMIPLLGLYGLILFALPLISEAGPKAMFENHAFLLPVPSGDFAQ